MPDNNGVSAHRVQRHRGVNQCFALFHAGLRGVHVHHVGPQPLSGDLERQQCSRRVLEKSVDDGEATQPVVTLCGTRPVKRNPMLGLLQYI